MVQLSPQSGFGPLAEAAVRGLENGTPNDGGRSRRAQPPGQHIHDRREHRASVHRRHATAPRRQLERRDQRLRERPQLNRHQPQRQPINQAKIIAHEQPITA
jgi:hypothetical protein